MGSNDHWLQETPPGWKPIVKDLIAMCDAEGVTVSQVKEKFGGLRFYIFAGSDKLYEAIDKAEEESYHICQECGAPGELRKMSWMLTLCDRHLEEYS